MTPLTALEKRCVNSASTDHTCSALTLVGESCVLEA